MPESYVLLLLIVAATIAGFLWAPWRYDVVAVLALLVSVFLGVVPSEAAFKGFGHPAVVMVAAVLVISRGLQNAGLVGWAVRFLAPTRRTTSLQIAAGSGLTLTLSAVMNNIGALALMLPVTMRNARKAGKPASLFLIPLSFASMLGGLITLIGTPPNIIVSGFREQHAGIPFGLFDFAPVGLVVALSGLAYLTTVGWRLLPRHEEVTEDERFRSKLAPFVTEVRVPVGSPFDGRQVRYVEYFCDNEITIMAVIRERDRFYAPRPIMRLRAGDVLLVEGDPYIWEPLCDGVRFQSIGHGEEISLRTRDVVLAEAVVMPNSPLERRSVRGLRMHENYGINLLGLARHGQPLRSRLKDAQFEIGDLLLLQGERRTLDRALQNLGCLVLAQRGARGGVQRRGVWLPVTIFAVALAMAALGWLAAPLALASAAIAFVISNVMSLQDAYDSIEWPVLVLLGALIPIGHAMKATGGANVIAESLISVAGWMPLWALIGLVLVGSMWLSDLIHNTPTAVLMAPVGASLALSLEVSVEPFLMAIAVGSASAYLTPIGHQSNTLVMGPGGYRFADYARVGIGLEALIVLVGVPMIMLVWPPQPIHFGP